ncbi:MAG: hypothetical protein QOH06_4108 [Acidobacteriota bacterium]|jgi:hypothetical protein|nr:hypothetical protein [Acidobacteriota bacterium]
MGEARRGPAVVSALLLVLGLSSGCAHAPAEPRSAVHQSVVRLESLGDCHRAESKRFVFLSDPWINLHHFLFQWARNVPPLAPGDPEAVEVPESRRVGELDERERAAWDRAVRFYRERLVGRDLVHDPNLIALRGPLGEIACAGGTPDSIVADVRAVLIDAMPVYRRHWWPEHLARNEDWIERLTSAIAPYETSLADRLADVYGRPWPDERIRVDITAYSSWHGAYTTNRPNQITMTSNPDLRGVKGADLLFHEVSHASFFEQPLLGQLSAAFRAHGAEPPSDLVHVVQFVTASELLRRQLRGKDLRGFKPFAEALYRSIPEWDRLRRVLEEHWVPFLDGKLERAQALDRIAAELTEHDKASEANHAYYIPVGNSVCTLRIDPGDIDARIRARLARP